LIKKGGGRLKKVLQDKKLMLYFAPLKKKNSQRSFTKYLKN
jgi:hypothetical protein